MVTKDLEKVERFHRMKERIAAIVLSTIKKREIIHGERALEARFPHHLTRYTKDYDVYSETPRKDAREAEQKLDREFEGDHFKVVPAEHKGTFKVKSKVNDESYADFTKPDEKVPYEKIKGKNYARLEFLKKKLRGILRDKNKKFRHAKDRDTLNRIKIYEQMQQPRQQLNNKKKELINNINTHNLLFVMNKKKKGVKQKWL